MLKALRVGSMGAAVGSWQQFLRGEGLPVVVDERFGPKTEAATRRWQRTASTAGEPLAADGVVGAATVRRAVARGWALFEYEPDSSRPMQPLSALEKDALFGKYDYEPAPTQHNPERIRILGDWVRNNIVTVTLPKQGGARERVAIHREVAGQLQAAFGEIERTGLLELVLELNGGFVARFVRGSRTTLSNHARGLALDLNARWNRLGNRPAPKGAYGSVVELVPVFNRWGFFWGGHYGHRLDGMHFEFAKRVVRGES